MTGVKYSNITEEGWEDMSASTQYHQALPGQQHSQECFGDGEENKEDLGHAHSSVPEQINGFPYLPDGVVVQLEIERR